MVAFLSEHRDLIAQLVLIFIVFQALQISAAVLVYFERKISDRKSTRLNSSH